MKVELPLMIQDPQAAQSKGMNDLVEIITVETEPFFLDGPVSERVAILDFDDKTGELTRRQARFIPAKTAAECGRFLLERIPDNTSQRPDGEEYREFIQVSVLATILETMRLAEGERVLGRRLQWAFGAPQLLVIPQAGEWANAYYERETHSLQFYYFTPADGAGTVYTSLSRDIVAHETAHAILDAIAPDIYDALSPEALALHEAFADMTAVIMSINSPVLAATVIAQTKGDLSRSTALSRIAEQFGFERLGKFSLRDISEPHNLDKANLSDPHELSTVLSSALYAMLVQIYEHLCQTGNNQETALRLAGGHLANMIFRGLDYLPPGEISFADYGRAILAADELAFPENEQYREFLRDAFVSRKIATRESLNTQGQIAEYESEFSGDEEQYPPQRESGGCATNIEIHLKTPVNLDELVNSEWVAYEFANRPEVRGKLIPPHVRHFRVHPRIRTQKTIGSGAAEETVSDLIFKVSWEVKEENPVGNGLPEKRRYTSGSTMVISCDYGHDVELAKESLLTKSGVQQRIRTRKVAPENDAEKLDLQHAERSESVAEILNLLLQNPDQLLELLQTDQKNPQEKRGEPFSQLLEDLRLAASRKEPQDPDRRSQTHEKPTDETAPPGEKTAGIDPGLFARLRRLDPKSVADPIPTSWVKEDRTYDSVARSNLQKRPIIDFDDSLINNSFSYSYTGKGTLLVRALLVSDSSNPTQQAGRTAMINRLLEKGILEFEETESGSGGVAALMRDNVLKISGTMRLLHIAGDDLEDS